MERVDSPEAEDGFLLERLPRARPGQAKVLEDSLAKRDRSLTAAPADSGRRRHGHQAPVGPVVSARRTATTTHVDFRPAQARGHLRPGRLAADPARRRPAPKTIRHRLDVYHKQTKPLIEHYEQAGLPQAL